MCNITEPNERCAAIQMFYRVRKRYNVKQTQSCRLLHKTNFSENVNRVLTKGEILNVFERLHSDGG